MTTFATTDSNVYHIEADQYVPGNILFSDRHALKTTDGTTTWLIAGSSSSGYSTSSGSSARFNYITGFHQVSATRVFLVDHRNHCMRMLDRTSNASYVSYAGYCCSRGYADGTSRARFYYPWSAIADKKATGRLLVTEWGNHAIRHVYTHYAGYQYVSTFYRSTSLLQNPKGITQEYTSGNLFITAKAHNVYKLSYSSKALTPLSGTGSGGFPFQAEFKDPRDLLLIGQHTILIADEENHRLCALDLNSLMTSSLCSGTSGTVDGNLTACSTNYPQSLAVVNGSLFIGQYQAIRKIEGLCHQLFLNYGNEVTFKYAGNCINTLISNSLTLYCKLPTVNIWI